MKYGRNRHKKSKAKQNGWKNFGEKRGGSDPLNAIRKIIKFVIPTIRPNSITKDEGLIRTSTKGADKVILYKRLGKVVML